MLSELKVKAQGRVTKIKSHSTKIMDLIAHQQMNIGSKITVKKVFEFDESMEILIDGKITKNISKQLANNIFIANDK